MVSAIHYKVIETKTGASHASNCHVFQHTPTVPASIFSCYIQWVDRICWLCVFYNCDFLLYTCICQILYFERQNRII